MLRDRMRLAGLLPDRSPGGSILITSAPPSTVLATAGDEAGEIEDPAGRSAATPRS
jgi:hypothetical protein